jgi:hypothetical protein
LGRATAEALSRHLGNTLPGDTKAEKKPRGENPKKDLDDGKVQERILHPAPRTITFEDGYKLTLHEPSLKVRRRIFGFATRVMGDAGSFPGVRSKEMLALRIVSLLNSREDLEGEMFFWTAKLLDAPGKIDDDKAKEISQEISDHALPADLPTLYEALSTLSGVELAKN